MDEFKPIDEKFVEELEVLAVLKCLCTIKFKADNGGTPTIKARIINVYTTDSEQYLRTEDGLSIRLDKILQVDNKPLKKNC